ncbi:hypothetical protein SAMN05421806_115135 [Streptomyces indicus]|uniref:Uncharacterized protein n=1 Tax=Streptomyces indicus TaxID=417292 RepID=A0A1G9GCP1_9ACTN|nr:hypothetical protein SAMN05421806_115135 [Streptomyces indicus]
MEPPEHARFARHIRTLAEVSAEEEGELVAAVLRDPDASMARSAIVRHFDERAPGLLTQGGFPAWATRMRQAVAGDGFLAERLREWTLVHAVVQGEPWSAEELATASDWCQRTVAASETPAPPEALAILAAWGRTRRVRTEAGRRLRGEGWR